jgi:hypothetical protein
VKTTTFVTEQKSSVASAIKTQNDSNRTQPERNKWFSKINIIIYVFIFIIICSFLVYQYILKPNPVRDAKKAASTYCNCEQNRYNETNKTLENFVNTFETYNFKDFEEANNKYIEIQESINSASNNKINAIYDDLRNKYIADNEKLNLFDLTYNAYKRKCDTINSDFIEKQAYHSVLQRKMKGKCISGDCQNGQGERVSLNGDKYIGEFRNNKMNGHGTYMWVSGEKYIGEFNNDRQCGEGTLIKADGTVIKGVW